MIDIVPMLFYYISKAGDLYELYDNKRSGNEMEY